jgi:hypothetical protein
LIPFIATSQDALRSSLAGQEMAEIRKRELENERFNVKLGPVSLRLSAHADIEATDNVRASENNTQADVVFRPQMNIFSVWRVTEKNSLTLGLGVGYAKYLNAREYDNLYLSPDTAFSFDIYVEDVVINLHDRFQYTQDVTVDPTISGIGSLSRFENTAGVQATWDLNKAFVSVGYDHRNFISAERKFDHLTHIAELFTSAIGFQLQPTTQLGLEIGGGLIDYQKNILQDNQHVAIGPFLRSQLSEYSTVRIGVGYVAYFLDALTPTNAPDTKTAFYIEASLQQRLGSLVTHTFAVSRTVQSGIASELLDLWRIQDSASWNILRNFGVSTAVSYEHGVQEGIGGETLDRYGASVSLSHVLTDHATAGLGYQFYFKNSDVAGRGYLQNRLVLNVAYTF